MKQRIEYIDIAKGILILLVVFHHTPQVGNRLLMLNSDSLQVMDNYNWIYSTFFMPTFFIITGYCSNFFINIKCFLWRNFKTIIGAGVTLSIIEGFVNNTLDHSFVYTVSLIPIIEKFFTHGTVYWFLTTLFVCKVGYYLLARYCRFIYIQGIIAVIFLCVAIMISPHIDKRDSNNYWYFLHSMFFLVFVWIGAMMRMYNCKHSIAY